MGERRYKQQDFYLNSYRRRYFIATKLSWFTCKETNVKPGAKLESTDGRGGKRNQTSATRILVKY